MTIDHHCLLQFLPRPILPPPVSLGPQAHVADQTQALFVWPPLLVGTLVGTVLLITLPLGAAVWWLTLIIARSAARLEVRSYKYHLIISLTNRLQCNDTTTPSRTRTTDHTIPSFIESKNVPLPPPRLP